MTNNIPIEIRDYALELEAEMNKVFHITDMKVRSDSYLKADTYTFSVGVGFDITIISSYHEDAENDFTIKMSSGPFHIANEHFRKGKHGTSPDVIARTAVEVAHNLIKNSVDRISDKMRREYSILRMDIKK